MWSANPEASAKEFGDYFLRCRDYRYRYITGVEFPGQPNVLNATQMRIAREQHGASQKRGLGQNERIVDFFLWKQTRGAHSACHAFHDALAHRNNFQEIESPCFELPQGARPKFSAAGLRVPESNMDQFLENGGGDNDTRVEKPGAYRINRVYDRFVPFGQIERYVAIRGDQQARVALGNHRSTRILPSSSVGAPSQ